MIKILKKHGRFLRRSVKNRYVYFLSFWRTTPLSNVYGFDRGTPIDRFFMESFLEENKQHVKGVCMEILEDRYTKRFGQDKVSKMEILDIEEDNKDATIIDDLRSMEKVEDETFDCIILTQVLHLIDDFDSTIKNLHRVLKKGGVLLVTLPSLSRIDCIAKEEGDFWRFTKASAQYAFGKYFDKNNLEVKNWGNARTGLFFWVGASQEEISKKVMLKNDPYFPNSISVKAVK